MTTALTQWSIVAIIVIVCAAYALRALLPASWRRALAARLRALGFSGIADRLGGGETGCAACARNPTVQRKPGG